MSKSNLQDNLKLLRVKLQQTYNEATALFSELEEAIETSYPEQKSEEKPTFTDMADAILDFEPLRGSGIAVTHTPDSLQVRIREILVMRIDKNGSLPLVPDHKPYNVSHSDVLKSSLFENYDKPTVTYKSFKNATDTLNYAKITLQRLLK